MLASGDVRLTNPNPRFKRSVSVALSPPTRRFRCATPSVDSIYGLTAERGVASTRTPPSPYRADARISYGENLSSAEVRGGSTFPILPTSPTAWKPGSTLNATRPAKFITDEKLQVLVRDVPWFKENPLTKSTEPLF